MDKFDIPPFKFKQMPPNEVREEWTRYKRNFEYMALANAVTNKTRLKHIFLARAGVDVQDVFSSIPDADVEERLGVDPFRIAINKLDEYFAPKQHEAYQRFLFWSQKMKDGESLDKFMLRAMDLASKCNFGNTQQEARDISVIDKVIQMAPDNLREKLLQKEHLSVDSVTKTVNAYQSVKFQAGQMAGHSNQPKPFQEVNVVNNDAAGAVGECSRCGYPGHFHYDERCPARDRTCKVCGNVGHFGIKCRSRKARKRKFNGPTGQRKRVKFERVRAVDTEEEATAIDCYVCNATDSSTPFQCSEWFERFDSPDIKPQDCSNVYGAKYCIKHIGRFEGGIGAKRYCSSRDLGNYCNYVRNPGDQIEYRSCIYTCGTDGCNGGQRTALSVVALLLAGVAWVAAARL